MLHRLVLGTILFCLVGANAAMAQDSFGIERGTGKIICTDDLDDQRTPEDDSYALSALWDQMVLGESPCALTPLDNGTWGMSRRISGADDAGNSADFKLYVLHDRFNWTLGSSTSIEDAGRPITFDSFLRTPQFFERLCAAKAALSIGAASHEGPTLPNQRLARARSQQISGVLSGMRTDCPQGQIPIIYAVNLGEHQNTRPARGSAPQRRVIIVAAEQMTIGVNLRQALRNALDTNAVLRDFDVSDYDLFEVEAQ